MNEHPKRFERLSRRLMGDEPGLTNVTLLGVSGEAQFGVDVTADMAGGRAVASCKCVTQATAADIREWSDDFLKNRDQHWTGVRRFILITSAQNITTTKNLDQLSTESAKFAAHGITYETWGPEQLTDRIQSAGREVSQRFLDTAWTNVLFGPPAPSGEPTAAQTEHLFRLQSLVSTHVDARLRRARDQLRSGEYSNVRSLIAELRSTEHWSQLRGPTQAAVLRLEAGIALTVGDLASARRYAETAQSLHPTEPRLLAMIDARESGPLAGLAILGTPETREGIQATVALRLEANQIEEAATTVDALMREDPEDPETLQLLAYVRLAQDRRPEVLAAAQAGERVAPHWLGIIRVASIARYASAVSPFADRSRVLQPNPLESYLLKIDDDSSRAMTAALAGFEKLIATEHAPSTDRAWRLACLANLPGREADAQAAVNARLAESPLNLEALGWATLRGLEAPLEPSRTALTSLYKAGKASEYEVAGFANVLLRMEGPAEAARILQQHEQQQEPAARATAQDWIARLNADAHGATADETGAVDPIGDALRLAYQDGDWTGVDRQLEITLGGPTPDPRGMELAGEAARMGRWTSLARYAAALERLDTAAAVDLVGHILQHTGAGSDVLAFLNKHRSAFPGSIFPSSLRRIEAQAHFELGDLPTALALAEQLVLDTGQNADRIFLANIHVASGHAQAAIPGIRAALASGTLSAGQAIRFSMATTQDDRTLAQDLWRSAMASGVPDEYLLPALGLGYRLGLDDENGPLMVRVHARAAAGADDIWLVNTDDLLEHVKARFERGQNITEMLAKGEVAAHLAMQAAGGSLAQLYRLQPPTPDRGPMPVFLMRHGARPIDLLPPIDWPDWKLHLDVTGLLIASQLDLLDKLESLSAPITISRHLADALYQFEQDAIHQQHTRVDAAMAIRDARLQDLLKIQTADADGSVHVRHERQSGDGTGLGPTLPSIRQALITSGAIDPNVGSKIQIDPDQDQSLAVAPAVGSRLVFPDNTLESLAMAGLLDVALAIFQCEIPLDDFNLLQSQVLHAATGETLAGEIATLRGRVARGVEAGSYVYAPEAATKLSPDQDEGGGLGGPFARSLLDVIGAPGVENGVIWIDDRYSTGFHNAGRNIIVGVVEVLNALSAAGLITSEERRAKLQRLRTAGAAFIPMAAEEVLASLRLARVHTDGTLVESRDLAVLRRNFSAALRLDPKLSVGEAKDRPSEIAFLLSARKLVEECLTLVWQEKDVTTETRRARSDWLWANIRMEQSLRVFGNDDPGAGSETLAALLVAGLLANACFIDVDLKGAGRDAARAFVDWIDEAALSPRSDLGDDQFFDLVASQIKALLSAGEVENLAGADEPSRIAAKLFRNRALQLMPPLIQQRLLQDEVFAETAAVQTILQIEVAGVAYAAEAFWTACREAMLTGSAEICDLEGHSHAMSSDGATVTLHSDPPQTMREATFPILRAEGDARLKAIEEFLAPLDLPITEMNAFSARAGGGATHAEAMAALTEAHLASPVTAYRLMDERLRKGQPIGAATFQPPAARRLLHHLRLADLETSFPQRVANAWSALEALVGPRFAFRRLAGLPVALSPALADTLERDRSRIAVVGQSSSPVMALHFARAAMDLGDSATAESELASLCDDLETAGELFSTLLRWSERAFQADAEWRLMQPAEQLALVWSHAHRVTMIMVEGNADLKFAQNFFAEQQPRRGLGAALQDNAAVRSDCAAPDAVFPSALLYHGLGYVLSRRALSEFPALEAKVQAALLNNGVDTDSLQPGLIMRSNVAHNGMGSFLGEFPEAAVLNGAEQAAIRTRALEATIAKLETDPDDATAWIWLSVVGRPCLPADLAARLDEVFRRTSLWNISQVPEGVNACRPALDARRRLGGPLSDEELQQKFYEIASRYAGVHRTPFALGDQSAAAEALANLTEAAAIAARADEVSTSYERFERLSLLIATAWPSAAQALRQMFDAIVRGVPPRESGPLWRAYLSLRAWP